MFNPNQNPVQFNKDPKLDPFNENFDYNEYKRRWAQAFKEKDVYIPFIIVIFGLCLAFSVLIWPCTTRFKIRAIAAFLITYLATQYVVTGINKHIHGGDK